MVEGWSMDFISIVLKAKTSTESQTFQVPETIMPKRVVESGDGVVAGEQENIVKFPIQTTNGRILRIPRMHL